MLPPLPAPQDAFTRPAEGGRLVALLWGFSLPFQISARVRKRSPELWRSWLRVSLVQGAVTLLTGAALVGLMLFARGRFLAWATSVGDVQVQGINTTAELFTLAFALFTASEWLVIAFSREFHEQLTRRMTLLLGLPPEDAEAPARIGFSFRWLGRRIRRWARGLKALVAVVPACAVLTLPLSPVGLSQRASGVLLVLWSFYWAALIACGKTAYGWRSEGDPAAAEPRLVRRLRSIPVVSLFGRFLGRMTRSSAPVAREVDAHTWEFLGIAAARLMLGVPVLYTFVRPTLPLASVLVLSTPKASSAREVERTVADRDQVVAGLDREIVG